MPFVDCHLIVRMQRYYQMMKNEVTNIDDWCIVDFVEERRLPTERTEVPTKEAMIEVDA